MNRYFRSVYVLVIVAFVLLFPVTGAWAATVEPNQGTLGTTFTISGSGFGAKQGTVFIGLKPAQVLAWSDAQIQCLVKVPMAPGTYDLVVDPQGKPARLTLYGAFSIMPPSINTPAIRPVFVSPRQEVTIGGTFFGSNKGLREVEIETLDGEKTTCEIVDWAMDSITFQLPDGISGRFHLEVTNGVGTAFQAWWGTFAEPPNEPAPMPGAYSYRSSIKTGENATAVSLHNKLWLFYPDRDSKICYQTWDGENWSANTPLVDSNGNTHKTYAQINPVVIEGVLYLFYTGTTNGICIVRYNNPAWESVAHKSVPLNDTQGRFAAVYNYVRRYVEIYITQNDPNDANNTIIKRLVYYPADNSMYWSGTPQIQKDPAHPTIAPYLTAVFNGNESDNTYVTYLSWADGYAGAVTELKDNAMLHQTRLWYWNSRNPLRGPSLVDLGEQYLAVIYNHFDTYSSYQKYDKDLHTVVPRADQMVQSNVPFFSPTTCNWAPNGIVFSTKVDDSQSPTGSHMASTYYAIVEDNVSTTGAYWRLVECEYLGYWVPTGDPKTVDLNASYQLRAQTFPLWPVIGLVDMPPFVRNGNPKSSSDTYISKAELSFTMATEDGLSGDYSMGPYIESGKRSPVTFDVSVGYAGGFQNSTKFTFTLVNGIEENKEGYILAFYLIPKFKVHELEWFDLNGAKTNIFAHPLETLAPTIRAESFDPEVGPDLAYYNGAPYFAPPYLSVAKTAADIAAYPKKFPMHASEDDRTRLATYYRDPTDSNAGFNFVSVVPDYLSQSGWGLSSPREFRWGVEKMESMDNGFYADFKVGTEIAGVIGFGVKGSVKILVNTKTEKTVEAVTTFHSQDPIEHWTSPIPAVTSFDATGYWLKPNASGYWVPNNRKGMGDTPWFITYRVPFVYPQWPLPGIYPQ